MAPAGQIHDYVRPHPALRPLAVGPRRVEALLHAELFAFPKPGLLQQVAYNQLAPVALRLRRPPQRRR